MKELVKRLIVFHPFFEEKVKKAGATFAHRLPIGYVDVKKAIEQCLDYLNADKS